MRTIFLSGFSINNKEWSEEVKKEIGDKIGLEIHEWPHWQTGAAEPGWIDKEVGKIIEKIGNDKVNILCKSIGTLTAVRLLNKKIEVVNKILLCGIPMAAFKDGDEESYKILAKIPAEKVLCIQNQNDNVARFEQVAEMFGKINPEIKIVSKPRDGHHYPYPTDFLEFFEG